MGNTRAIHYAGAFAATLLVATPAGAEADRFPGRSASEVRSLVANACLDRGWSLESMDAASVSCLRPGVPSRVMQYGPRGARWAVIVKFTFVEIDGSTRVQVQEYIESENALGMKRVHPEPPESPAGTGFDLLVSLGAE